MMEFCLSIGSAWILHPLLLAFAFLTIYFVKCSKKGKPPPKSLKKSSKSQSGNVKSNIKSIHPASKSNAMSSLVQSKTKPTEENAAKSKQSTVVNAKSTLAKNAKDKTRTKDDEDRVPDEDYGEVPEPTESAKKRRERQLENEKKEKIQKGFYQSKSDEDDTLEPIKSLKQEQTEESTKKSSKKKLKKN